MFLLLYPLHTHANAFLVQVGMFNSTGKKHHGHFSIWITNKLQEQLLFLGNILIDLIEMKGWVNGNLYLPTSEQLGILLVPDDVQLASGMAEFNLLSADKKQPHLYLAHMQGTQKAILLIHTTAEQDLFCELMKTNLAFGTQEKGPIWKLAIKVWNEYADRETGIFYKVCLDFLMILLYSELLCT
jgi:hypothetical protein